MTTAMRVGEIELPNHFRANSAEKKEVHQFLSSRIPYEIELEFDMTHHPFLVVIYRAQQCPWIVPFAECRELIEACKPGEILLGLQRTRAPFYGSFRGEDPHWVFEVMSRRGKSTLVSLSIAQILHQDPAAAATGIDPKVESFKALYGVPRFRLANDPNNVEEMWKAISDFRDEMYARRAARGADPSLEFSYNLLVIDEANSFSLLSKIYWRHIRQQGDPPYPPVWEDLAMIMAQGAAYRCHLIMTGQRLDETIFGGLRLISMAGFRGLGGWRAANYKRLGLGGGPVPLAPTRRGRWLYNDGESETLVQNVWATDGEINDYARTLPPGVAPLVPPQRAVEPAADQTDHLVGLDAAADHLGLSKAAFVKRRQRQPVPGEGKRGNQPAWSPADLDAWSTGQLVDQEGTQL